MLPDSDGVPWLIRRACAGEWEYRPEWVEYLQHPSSRKRFAREGRMFVVPDLQDRSVQVGLEIIRRQARQALAGKDVKHFEVVQNRVEGFRAVPHRQCHEEGCKKCQNLGVLFVKSENNHVDLFGWMAIVHVAL